MDNPFSLKDKNIFITGASSGIGRQCAISCSQMGANLVLLDIDNEGMAKTLSLMTSTNHLAFQQDITEYNELEIIIKNAVAKVGKISGFIHSAGIEMTLPLKVMKPYYYEKIFAINAISGFEIAKILSKKKYINIESASFVFIASIMSVVANAGLTGYCASKGAIISAVRSMSIELAHRNIRVNSISPGYIQTEMMKKAEQNMSELEINELKKNYLLGLGKSEDVSNACIYLLSNASRWVTGTNLIVDGGYSAR
jgi:NAD(P)-dependent dehydrogenase (short-subunit alcohol dehydrogenase family)